MRAPASTFRTYDLPAGSLVPFTSIPGERVRILYGRVWLTEEGSVHDAFLGSGEEVQLGGRGLAVIEALGPASVQLLQDLPGRSPLARAAEQVARFAASARRRLAWRAPRALRGSA